MEEKTKQFIADTILYYEGVMLEKPNASPHFSQALYGHLLLWFNITAGEYIEDYNRRQDEERKKFYESKNG